jgi:hypothetical protein
MDFKKWNKQIDKEQYEKDLEEIKKNGGTGEYKEVPHGEYTVKVEKMELKESKKGDPMLSVMFRILEGEFKKSCIFMNQVVLLPFQIHIANQFLESLDTGVEVAFHGDYESYNDMILDCAEACDSLEFALVYGENNKGFNTFKITEVYDA